MDADPYKKREIDEFMRDIKETLERIEQQTTRTNGRVSRLEVWRGFISGGIAILAALVIPILFTYIK